MAGLTILATASLCGDLAALPRLYTLIKRERAASQWPVLLIDLGGSCAADHWLCAATHGRALLVALDSMGYDAFYLGADEPLLSDPVTLGKLRDTILTPLVTADQTLTLTKHAPLTLHLSASAAPRTVTLRLDDTTTLIANDTDTLLMRRDWPGESVRSIPLTPDIAPDPTISSVIEFVESEARYADQQKRKAAAL